MGRTLGVILAAGAGSRFHGPTHKLKAPLGRQSIIEHACESLRGASVDLRAVVVGAEPIDDLVPPGFELLHNVDWESGQASSLAVAVAFARDQKCEALVVALGDQPGITTAAWDALAASTSQLATATYDGEPGHPIRLGAKVWDELPSDGDSGARELLRGGAHQVDRVVCSGNPKDVDVVEDLSQWI